MDGFSVGGAISVDPKNKGLESYDAGIRYEQDDFNFNLQTLKSGQSIQFGYYHRINSVNQIGVRGAYARDGDRRNLDFVQQYDLNSSTITKTALSTSGVAQFAVEHSLNDPRVKVNFASSFNFKGGASFAADKFGLGFTFGDY